MGSDSGDVALFVRARWAEIQRSGAIAGVEPAQTGYEQNWHILRVGVFCGLAIAAVATAIMAR